jgi:hypothetical protein
MERPLKYGGGDDDIAPEHVPPGEVLARVSTMLPAYIEPTLP